MRSPSGPSAAPGLAGLHREALAAEPKAYGQTAGGLVMLHGYPQNHLTWRHIAPALADDHTVVLADLRGYGDSGKPDPDTACLPPTPSGPWP